MNKWIVTRAYCVGDNAKGMMGIYPSAHDSEEDAFDEMIDLVMYDLSGIKFTIVRDEWGRGFESYYDEDGILVASIGPDYADVDTKDVHARYIIAEVGF